MTRWGPTNNYSKWFQVCEHKVHNNGQIAFLRKRLPGAHPDTSSIFLPNPSAPILMLPPSLYTNLGHKVLREATMSKQRQTHTIGSS